MHGDRGLTFAVAGAEDGALGGAGEVMWLASSDRGILERKQLDRSGEQKMPFVNEYIPEEDFLKYKLREIDASFPPKGIPVTDVNRRDWTIDRARDIYLRQVTSGREDESHLSGWTFYWRGDLIWFLRESIEYRGERNGPQWAHFKVRKLVIPSHRKQEQEEILRDLEEAFLTYAGGGVHVISAITDYKQQIDFELE